MSESVQNRTLNKIDNTVTPYKTEQFDAYISYLAIGGLSTTDDGLIKKIPLAEFCHTYGLSRTTIYDWKKRTPGLGEMVRIRREEIIPIARETALWNQLYLLGMQTGDKRAAVDALKTLLGHFAGLRLPQQAVKVEAGESWAAMLESHQKARNNVQEGEVIDASVST